MKELDKKVITNLNIVKKFHKAPLVEALKKVENPGTGWYDLYTFDATCADPVLYVACEEEEIVLLLIDIGGFRGKELSTEALLSIRQIFYFFKEKKKDMIVRFAYDTEGKGMEKEPEAAESYWSISGSLAQSSGSIRAGFWSCRDSWSAVGEKCMIRSI